jgi:hypothetical protein
MKQSSGSARTGLPTLQSLKETDFAKIEVCILHTEQACYVQSRHRLVCTSRDPCMREYLYTEKSALEAFKYLHAFLY